MLLVLYKLRKLKETCKQHRLYHPVQTFIVISCLVKTLAANERVCAHDRAHAFVYRADAVSAMPGYISRPSWQLPPFKNRPALAVWNSDDRLCTFVAGNPRAPPLAQDIYRLRLLDQEDEQQAQEQQHTSQQVGTQPCDRQLAGDMMQAHVILHIPHDRHTHLFTTAVSMAQLWVHV